MAKRKNRQGGGESSPESVEAENTEETLDENQEVALQEDAEEVQVPQNRDPAPEPVDYPVGNSLTGECTLINRNNYPVSIYFLNGDSTTLSPKERATLSRSIVNSTNLPQGVSCV